MIGYYYYFCGFLACGNPTKIIHSWSSIKYGTSTHAGNVNGNDDGGERRMMMRRPIEWPISGDTLSNYMHAHVYTETVGPADSIFFLSKPCPWSPDPILVSNAPIWKWKWLALILRSPPCFNVACDTNQFFFHWNYSNHNNDNLCVCWHRRSTHMKPSPRDGLIAQSIIILSSHAISHLTREQSTQPNLNVSFSLSFFLENLLRWCQKSLTLSILLMLHVWWAS